MQAEIVKALINSGESNSHSVAASACTAPPAGMVAWWPGESSGSIAENDHFVNAKFTDSFVMTEYFGYLRRDPDRGGYDFWLDVLNNREPGNYRSMVCAFLTSSECQHSFSSL